MTKSRKFGSIGVRPHSVRGQETGKWVLDIPATLTATGKRKRKLCGSKTEAVNLARELQKRLRMKELGYREIKPQDRKTFNESVKDWKKAQNVRIDAGKLQSASLVTRMHELAPVQDFLGDRDISQISTDLMERYQAWRRKQVDSPATINSEIATLKQVLWWEHHKGNLKSVPTVDRIEPENREWDIPDDSETALIIKHLPNRHKTLVRLLAETGVRPGEAFNLPWRHVDLKEGYFDVKPFHSWRPKGKTKVSWRRVWMSLGLRDEMQKLPKNGAYVFSSRVANKPITSIDKALTTAVKQAKIRRESRPIHVTAGTFRKAFATHQAMRGVPISILKKQMGHSKTSRMLDQYYIHIQDQAVRDACRELPVTSEDALAKSGNEQQEGKQAEAA